ncbi:MAG: carbohydrate ABC transporter permease [Caldilineaceae bacterium]
MLSALASWDKEFYSAWRNGNRLAMVWRIGVYLALIVGGLLFMLPALWMISTAFKTLAEANSFPPVWIPTTIEWSNFTQPFQDLPFAQFYRNTLFLTLSNLVGVLLSCTPVAYAFARLNFRGRDTLFIMVLATMMLPDQSTLIPVYVLFAKLHWINTFLPLIVPRYFATDAFIIFLMRQFFKTIPRDLDDACKIDGGGPITSLLRIIIPLSLPVFGVVLILVFVGEWNSFFWPLVYLSTMEHYTISLGLRLFQTRYFVQMNVLMAMSLLASLPTVILFFITQRQFLKGIVLTGVNR